MDPTRRHKVDRLGALLRRIDARKHEERLERLAQIVSIFGLLLSLAAVLAIAAHLFG